MMVKCLCGCARLRYNYRRKHEPRFYCARCGRRVYSRMQTGHVHG